MKRPKFAPEYSREHRLSFKVGDAVVLDGRPGTLIEMVNEEFFVVKQGDATIAVRPHEVNHA